MKREKRAGNTHDKITRRVRQKIKTGRNITPVSGSEGSEFNEVRQSKGAYRMWNAQSETSKKNVWKEINA